MNNEMKFEKNGLLIPNGALEELGLVGISLSAWLGQDHILLMPQEMTALQLLHALEAYLELRRTAGCAAKGVQDALRRRL